MPITHFQHPQQEEYPHVSRCFASTTPCRAGLARRARRQQRRASRQHPRPGQQRVRAQAAALRRSRPGPGRRHRLSRPVFRTIEVETNDYIIGSVPVPPYPEAQDVHVYVHRDGWFLAYYPVADPSGKIVDWWRYNDSGLNYLSTKLENALSVAALPVGVTPNGVSFYDFRHPDANRFIMIADWTEGTDDFQVNLPVDFGYFERSWSFATTSQGELKLNGQQLIATGTDWTTAAGTLNAVQLPLNQYNRFEIFDPSGGRTFGGLVLTYRVP